MDHSRLQATPVPAEGHVLKKQIDPSAKGKDESLTQFPKGIVSTTINYVHCDFVKKKINMEILPHCKMICINDWILPQCFLLE